MLPWTGVKSGDFERENATDESDLGHCRCGSVPMLIPRAVQWTRLYLIHHLAAARWQWRRIFRKRHRSRDMFLRFGWCWNDDLAGCCELGHDVRQLAGASAVSIAGTQLAKAAVNFCQKLGATTEFNYHKDDWIKFIQEATNGHGVDVIVDFIGKDSSQGNFEAAALDGRIVQLAGLSGSKLAAGLDISLLEHKDFDGREVDWEVVNLTIKLCCGICWLSLLCPILLMGCSKSKLRRDSLRKVFRLHIS